MSKCTNIDLGKLLHGYELGILDDDECDRFEAHLIECGFCHGQLQSFEQQAALLTSSEPAKSAVREALRSLPVDEPFLTRIRRLLWPKSPLLLRPAVAYLLVLLMAIPLYLNLKEPPSPTVSEFQQTIRLSPTRSTGGILKKSAGDQALLTFRLDAYDPTRIYGLWITSESGAVVYSNSRFRAFDELEIGSLALVISEIKPGRYQLLITAMDADSISVIQEYTFWVAE